MTQKPETREIAERWIIEGALELLTPTHLGNGDSDPSIDLPLVTDSYDGRATLNGSSLAGALRHYLNEKLDGYEPHTDPDTKRRSHREKVNSPAAQLFGERPGFDLKRRERENAKDGQQSRLLISDALGREKTPQIDVRYGVRIEPTRRTAADKALFDMQLLAAGSIFDLRMELLVADGADTEELRTLLAAALRGLQTEEIPLGSRKGRGLGECRVSDWHVWRYDLHTKDGLKGWLTHGRVEPEWRSYQQAPKRGDDIVSLLGVELQKLDQRNSAREIFSVRAKFDIDGSLLVRSGFEEDGPDVVHIGGADQPVLPGTSLAGVMRGQALRIARTLAADPQRAILLVDELFGIMPEGNPEGRRAGRVRVREQKITGSKALVQSRVKIDRFTGGASETALFEEQPAFGGHVELVWELRRALPDEDETEKPAHRAQADKRFQAEVGLLLLMLKDLWTGFLPVGGGANVGRGRLMGIEATLRHVGGGFPREWKLATTDNNPARLTISGPDGLNNYVNALVDYLRQEGIG